MKSVLVVRGGWEGHEPIESTDVFIPWLRKEGFEVEVSETLDAYTDAAQMASYDLIIQCWTMGEINNEQLDGLLNAVQAGAGFAGWHGGMSDSFRSQTGYQFMVGGQFVAHPGNVLEFQVKIENRDDPITAGLNDFTIRSEQYYMHVDPSNEVLATTRVLAPDAPWVRGVEMPVVWKRRYGDGKVFHNTLGHVAADFETPECLELTKRGILWACR